VLRGRAAGARGPGRLLPRGPAGRGSAPRAADGRGPAPGPRAPVHHLPVRVRRLLGGRRAAAGGRGRARGKNSCRALRSQWVGDGRRVATCRTSTPLITAI